jgi:hypothetical protein
MTNRSEKTARRDDAPDEGGATWSQAAQRHFDSEDTVELTTEVVFAIADARGTSPSEMSGPPLYECVDVPALESALFGTDESGTRQGVGSVDFRYAEYLVTVDSDGWIRVAEQATTERAEGTDTPT